MELYPLKFVPILKERLWGGTRLGTELGKKIDKKRNIGESWELSAVEGSLSVVSNGYLAGNDIQDLVEVYMEDLVGEKVYEKYGLEFPILVKFIDANADLSVQVHPDNETARERHRANGKTEMWYILDDTEAPKLIIGFDRDTDRKQLLEKLEDGTASELFRYEQVRKGDAFFIPAGRVHSIGAGNLLLEIQQTSDVTYRIYDYDRVDNNGEKRELHLDLALDIIDYSEVKQSKIDYKPKSNQLSELVDCDHFVTDLLLVDQTLRRDYYRFDSFVIIVCVEGECVISGEHFDPEIISKGETVLLPASIPSIEIEPRIKPCKLIETYMDGE